MRNSSTRARSALDELECDRGALVCFARRYTTNHDDAEDAVQAASIIALRRPDVTGPTARAWLHVVIRNAALAERRRRHDAVSIDLALMERVGGEAWAERLQAPHHDIDALLDVRAALGACKPDERLALVARVAGWSYGEIAERNDWTYTKVNRCVSEGRARVRERVAA